MNLHMTSKKHKGEEEAIEMEWVTCIILCSVCKHGNCYRIVAYPDDTVGIEFMWWSH